MAKEPKMVTCKHCGARRFVRNAAPIKHLTNGAKSDILSERSKDSRYLYGVNPAEDGIIF